MGSVTQLYTDLNLRVTGYMLNVALDERNQEVVSELQQRLLGEFGDIVWTLPPESLHITLMDWVAPLVDYGRNKDLLFHEVFSEYDSVLHQIISSVDKFDITFNTLNVSTGGIFLTAVDNGEFQKIRSNFTDRVELQPGTKQPPKIIHTTIARFQKEIPLEEVEDFISQQKVHFTQTVGEFRLVNEKTIPMLEYELIKTYPLNYSSIT